MQSRVHKEIPFNHHHWKKDWYKARPKFFLQFATKGALLRNVPILFHWMLKANLVKFKTQIDPLLITVEKNADISNFSSSSVFMIN